MWSKIKKRKLIPVSRNATLVSIAEDEGMGQELAIFPKDLLIELGRARSRQSRHRLINYRQTNDSKFE